MPIPFFLNPFNLPGFSEEALKKTASERPNIILYLFQKKLFVFDDKSHWHGDVSLISQVACLGCDEENTLSLHAHCWEHVWGPQEIPLSGRGVPLFICQGRAPLAIQIDLLMINTDRKCDLIRSMTAEAVSKGEYRKNRKRLAEAATDLAQLIANRTEIFDLISRAYGFVIKLFEPDPFIGRDTITFTWDFDELGRGLFPTDGSLQRRGDFGYTLEILWRELS